MMKTKDNTKRKMEFAEAVQAPAQIIRLFPEKDPNEAIRLRQYAAQREMLRIARKAAPAVIAENALRIQYQAPRYTPDREKTIAEQAAMQGEKGLAFKL